MHPRTQNPASPTSKAFLVDRLTVVTHTCRCLERYLSRQTLALQGPLDRRQPELQEQARVDAVLSEGDKPDYWVQASRDGNREAHYRGRQMHRWLPLALLHCPLAAELHCFTHACPSGALQIAHAPLFRCLSTWQGLRLASLSSTTWGRH